ncbi:hypothetical protein NDU88_001011 [Pleurodeles waltl]|uniref:Uncharacterized protein n=1 Tax=Pleurodeles waltl TaxID=8319 RepID=A0AAV7RBK7_PLEWA|nr:hypothetical protein NDU88_001011 [Pleurodeles waltl]
MRERPSLDTDIWQGKSEGAGATEEPGNKWRPARPRQPQGEALPHRYLGGRASECAHEEGSSAPSPAGTKRVGIEPNVSRPSADAPGSRGAHEASAVLGVNEASAALQFLDLRKNVTHKLQTVRPSLVGPWGARGQVCCAPTPPPQRLYVRQGT